MPDGRWTSQYPELLRGTRVRLITTRYDPQGQSYHELYVLSGPLGNTTVKVRDKRPRPVSDPCPWFAVAGASRPPGAPEDEHRPLSLKPSFPLPRHVLSIDEAIPGSRWRTTVRLRLADPRGNLYIRLLTLVPPAVGETPTEHWVDSHTELVLLEARDDRQDQEVVAFARDDPATFHLHFGFWAFCTYRIETGRWAGATIEQGLKDGENLPPS